MANIVVDPPLDFAGRLYKAINADVVNWAIGEGSFVIVALLEALSGKEGEELRDHLKGKRKVLQAREKTTRVPRSY